MKCRGLIWMLCCLVMASCDSQSKRMEQALQGLSEQVNNETLNFELTDNDWTDFINLTDLIFDGFSQRLWGIFPKLGKWDVRICCLSKNGFSNQVISILLDTQTDSYYKRKTRIKQMILRHKTTGVPSECKVFSWVLPPMEATIPFIRPNMETALLAHRTKVTIGKWY